MKEKWDELLENPENLKKIIDFIEQSDYEFFSKLREDMTDEAFEEFSQEFPEAKVALDDTGE